MPFPSRNSVRPWKSEKDVLGSQFDLMNVLNDRQINFNNNVIVILIL
jgi:hypothetical protein